MTLGNYPQAFTHPALIQIAVNLQDAGDEDALHAWATRRASTGWLATNFLGSPGKAPSLQVSSCGGP